MVMEWLSLARWSPYVVGAGIGILSWLTFLISDRGIGCSTAFAQTAGMLERLFRGEKVYLRPYFREVVPKVDWGWMLVVGIALGAFASSLLSGTFSLEVVPALWAQRFGGSVPLRWAAAFLGGVALGFGSRWAGGCTSGHGITGTLQLVIGSWLAALCFFVGGVLTAHLLF
jgi:uncharacterized membrane protein YedE/YeeE